MNGSKCDVNAVKAAIIAVRDGIAKYRKNRNTKHSKMRPEQMVAVQKDYRIFQNGLKKEEPDRALKFLWNAKMRFGKNVCYI